MKGALCRMHRIAIAVASPSSWRGDRVRAGVHWSLVKRVKGRDCSPRVREEAELCRKDELVLAGSRSAKMMGNTAQNINRLIYLAFKKKGTERFACVTQIQAQE